jgi:flagellar hook protein FlgE
MMPSLDSAISGLKGSQTMMDILGNNIANVNTAGFKSSQINFADLLSQTMQGASQASTTGLGGTNPIQVGQGVSVASVDTDFTTGSMQQTGVDTDLGINGDGLFMLASTPTGSGQYSFTRDGDFSFDSNGNLVSNANGMYVQGWTADAKGDITASPGAIGKITIPLTTTQVSANATTSMSLSGNLDSESTTPQDVVASVYDSLGNQYQVELAFKETATPDKWNWTVSSITGPNSFSGTSSSSGTLTFNTSGALSGTGLGTVSFTPLSGATAEGITLHLSGLTQYASTSTAALETQNGYTSGNLSSYSIDKTGTITGSFSNGIKKALAQIALASFPNVNGLQSDGGNDYSETPNSGAYTASTAGTGSLGSLESGSLEASNVDLSQEMSNMIIAQSAFDANSKVITTDDNLLQTLDNMIPA